MLKSPLRKQFCNFRSFSFAIFSSCLNVIEIIRCSVVSQVFFFFWSIGLEEMFKVDAYSIFSFIHPSLDTSNS